MILVARQDPGTLDYTKSNLTALRLWIPANVVEPLVYFNKDGTVSPGVAESWEISEDRLTYAFKIREAKFSNGEPVTVDDVIYSLNTMKTSPVTQNSSAYQAVESRSEEHTSELQSRENLVCRLLLEKKNKTLHFDIDGQTDRCI